MLSGRGLCDELITSPEESYRLCCVVVCDLETSRIGAPCIYDISNLRVNIITNLHYVVMIKINVMYRTVFSFSTDVTVVHVSANFDSISINVHKHKQTRDHLS